MADTEIGALCLRQYATMVGVSPGDSHRGEIYRQLAVAHDVDLPPTTSQDLLASTRLSLSALDLGLVGLAISFFPFNRDLYPQVTVLALRTAEDFVRQGMSDALDTSDTYSVEPPTYREEVLDELLRQPLAEEVQRYEAWARDGKPDGGEEALRAMARAFAPAALTDGHWMHCGGDQLTSALPDRRLLFRLFYDEMGESQLPMNHLIVYRDMLTSMGEQLPPTGRALVGDRDEGP